MKFYIKIVDNQPNGEPLLEFDMKNLFPNHNWDSGTAPSGYAEYMPSQLDRTLGTFEVIEVTSYFIHSDGTVRDTLKIRPMNQVEKDHKIKMLKLAFVAKNGYKSWHFNEALEIFEAPFQPENPVNGGKYRWDEANQKWDRIG